MQSIQDKANRISDEATRRFWEPEPVMAESFAVMAGATIADVEEQERRQTRESLLNPNDGLALERILGKSDLVGVNYLEIGLATARTVARIQVRDQRGRVLGFGTGSMVSPNLMLTNNHVLESADIAQRSLADFNYQDDANFIPRQAITFPLDPARFFYTDPDLDFTLVAVSPMATDGKTPLSAFGWLHLLSSSGKALVGEYVSIIQHPEGSTKQLALRENKLVGLKRQFIHYETDTQPGSSGSPVFNDQWDVVALHHAGVKKVDEQGRPLTADGRLWKPSMGAEQLAWVANEGVRISSIMASLKRRRWTRQHKTLIDELLNATAPTPGVTPTPGGTPGAPASLETVTLDLEWYAGSQGYDPEFLSQPVPMPKVPSRKRRDLVRLLDNSGQELKYTNFSVLLSKSRKIAYFTAVNIDGAKLKSQRRERDVWLFDPRIDKKYQAGPDLYANNDLDRGHMVRRLDPMWGSRWKEAGEDSFHFTNAAPQHKNLNQRTWQNLEDYVLRNAGHFDLKISVFTGPVLRADDLRYRGIYRIPAEYWKVVVMVKEDGNLSATAYLQTQKNLIADLEFAYGAYKTYQVPVALIEELTGLNFGLLRQHDPLASPDEEEAAAAGLLIEEPEDIRL